MDKGILKEVEVIGISGKLGTGKNFITEKVLMKMLEPTPTMTISLADQIKVNGIVQHGLDRYKCFVEKDEHTRKVMQRVGTEEGRDVYGPDIWIRYVMEWMIIHASRGVKRFLIPDVRFHNEFDFVKELGGIMIRINAPKRNRIALEREAAKGSGTPESIGSHRSETDLDNGREFDYVIENDIDSTNVFIQVRNMVRDMQEKNREETVIFCDLDDTICKCNEYYVKQADKVKELIKRNLMRPLLGAMDVMFTDSMKRHNGDYAHNVFEIDRFAKSLASTVDDFSSYMHIDSVDDVKNQAYALGMEVFDNSYVDIDDRVEQLKELSKFGRIVLFTMGDRLEQVKKMAELNITDYDYEVFDFKDATIFRHLQKKYRAKMYCMIGDSIHRDVMPAMEAGIDIVVHIRNNNKSYWKEDKVEMGYAQQVDDIHGAISIIKEISANKKSEVECIS